jgi:hypothetical protein
MVKLVVVPIIFPLVYLTNNRHFGITVILEVQCSKLSLFTNKSTVYTTLKLLRLMMYNVNPNEVSHTRGDAHSLGAPHIQTQAKNSIGC